MLKIDDENHFKITFHIEKYWKDMVIKHHLGQTYFLRFYCLTLRIEAFRLKKMFQKKGSKFSIKHFIAEFRELNHFETLTKKFFVSKIFWIIHKFWSILTDFCHI